MEQGRKAPSIVFLPKNIFELLIEGQIKQWGENGIHTYICIYIYINDVRNEWSSYICLKRDLLYIEMSEATTLSKVVPSELVL